MPNPLPLTVNGTIFFNLSFAILVAILWLKFVSPWLKEVLFAPYPARLAVK